MSEEAEHIIIPGAEEVARYAPTDPAGAEAGASSAPPANGGTTETTEELQARLAECRDRLLRAQAECANIAKRLNQQHAESLRLAGMGLARDLLAVVDGFERMLAGANSAAEGGQLVSGVKLLAELLHKALRDHGVQAIEAVGGPFDPQRHEAMLQDRQSDLPPGTVTAEWQRGYTMHGRVLRPARVSVATAADEPGGPAAGGETPPETGPS